MVEVGLDSYGDVKLLGELLNNVEAEAGTRRFAGAVVFGAIKLFKDPFLVGFTYTDTRIFNGKQDSTIRFFDMQRD